MTTGLAMLGRFEAFTRRVYRIAAIVVVTIVAVVLGMTLVGALLPGLAHLYGFDQWDSLRDRVRFADERRLDGMLEKEFASRWKTGVPFALSDVLPDRSEQLCLAGPARESRKFDAQAARSVRPAWWRRYERNGVTLLVPHTDGRAMAFRITSYGIPILDNPRIGFSFRFPTDDGFACVGAGTLILQPSASADRYLFEVRQDSPR